MCDKLCTDLLQNKHLCMKERLLKRIKIQWQIHTFWDALNMLYWQYTPVNLLL